MDAPVVTALGHAGLRIDAPGLRMLCDPWLSPGGTFLGSWFQFPDNSHLRRPDILDCDWVAISHEHLDHLDLPLLLRLPASVRLVIPHYPAPELRNRIAAAGLKNVVIELDAWQRLALNDRGDWVTVIPERSPMCHDAAILVHAAGHAIMHTNDARLSVAQVRRATDEVGRPIDLMGVQMSGASWHPICYEYPSDVVARLSADKRNGKFKAVARLLRAAPPRIAMPYAGPPCFLDPAVAHHNASIPEPGIFPDQSQAVAFLSERIPAQRCAALMPGDRIDVATGVVTPDPKWSDFSYDDVSSYLAAYADRRRGEIDELYLAYPDPPRGSGLSDRFVEHFTHLGELSDYFLRRIGMTVRFEVLGADGGTWDVRLGPDTVSVSLLPDEETPQYRLRVAARWLDPVLRGHMHWEDLLLSLRVSAWREPDVYNDYLVGLLKHANAEALSAVERFETSRDPEDTVVIEDRENRWEVSRYCPHAGEDLSEGSIIHNGVLRCLGHNFDFDLATGQCLNARCDPLVARQLQPAEALR
jgi:nitrite reductase/ring-hydroxylating ferredoxin subunit